MPLFVALLAAALLVLGGVLVAIRLSLPADGTITAARTALPDGVKIDVLVADDGLRSGDEVTAADGRPLALRTLPDAHVGETLTYQVRRGAQVLEIDVDIRRYAVGAAVKRNWPLLALVGSALTIATYVFLRRPHDRAARALLIVASLLACGSSASIFGLQVLDVGGGPGWWANLVGSVAYVFVWPALFHMAMVFPTPSPALTKRPWLITAAYCAPVVLYAAQLAVELPRATSPLKRAGTLVPAATVAELVFVPLILLALLAAYRSADAVARARLRLVGGTFVCAAVMYLGLWRLPLLFGRSPLVPPALHLLLLLPCPVAIGVAILRLHLFDIDVAIRRSLVYVSLTGCLLLVYAAAVGLVSQLVRANSELVALMATGVVAVLFSPLRDKLQRLVSRLLYGERDDPYAIITRLGQTLENTPAPNELLLVLVTSVAEALRLPYAAIELVRAEGLDEAARYGRPVGSTLSLPLAYQGEAVGNLVVGERSPGDGFGTRDRRALTSLAAQLGMAVRTARLTVDLQRSRERLVAAREEERRRIRRDLHDGLGPALAATSLQVQAARRLLEEDPRSAESILAGLNEHLKMVIAGIRELVDGLRPPALDQLGLVGAIEQQVSTLGGDPVAAGQGLRVVVETEGDLRSLPAAVEVAAFRIVCEAVLNAHRHGAATGCRVRLTRDGALEVVVTDDGQGLTAERRGGGTGVESMRERATELGGSFLVEAPTTGGTRVWARLPLHPA